MTASPLKCPDCPRTFPTQAARESHRLAHEMEAYVDDPLGFVLDCFPWGTGELANEAGPDEWQRQFLADLRDEVRKRDFDGHTPVSPVRFSVASGHGIGKSAMMAWLHWWIMSTRHNAKGRVTANTAKQLAMTTWAEIQRWGKIVITRDWFEVNTEKIYHKDNKEGWFSVPVTCDEHNSEAFAGQHNKESTSFYLMDESSLIPDKIYDVAQGGMTDGEPMWFAFGNPTRNTGWFYECTFGEYAHRWNTRSIDSRTCKFPNHEEHRQWIEDHGIDSDFCRVRILGMAPKTAEDQLIGKDVVDGARTRAEIEADPEEPLIAGVDIPDGGAAWFVVRFRRGLNTRPGPMVPAPIRRSGDQVDRSSMTAILARVLGEKHPHRKVGMMFIDSQPGAAIVERLHAMNYDRVMEVAFDGKSPDRGFFNMRAFMWGKALKDWLGKGTIDPEDAILRKQLSAPGFHYRVGGDGSLVVESKAEMKKRGIASPDDADALALTFAYPVPREDRERADQPRGYQQPRSDGWMRG